MYVCVVVCHLLPQFGFQSRSLKAVYYLQQAGVKQARGCGGGGVSLARLLLLLLECSMLAANRAV